jgi:hypothetical protein
MIGPEPGLGVTWLTDSGNLGFNQARDIVILIENGKLL